MSPAAAGVVKGSQVRLAGRRTLGEPQPQALAADHTGHSGVTARIVEQSAEEAVVEIVCTCGSVIRLRCACGAAGAEKR